MSIHDRTPRILLLSLTHLNMPIDKVITQTILWFYSHLGHFLTWERPLDASSGVSPRYSSATNFQLTTSSLYRYNMMADYAFFLQGSDRWGKDLALLWGCLNICLSLQQFHIMSITQSELSSLTSLRLGLEGKILQ